VSAVTLVHQVFDGLVQYDENLNIIPAIARSWQISPDGLIYQFFLRRGVKFHNNREVTAHDFVYSFTRMLDPKVQAQGANLFARIEGASAFMGGKVDHVPGLQAPSPYTLVIRLEEQYIPFLPILATYSARVVPRDEVEALEEEFGKMPVGAGPFRFAEWSPNKIILEANDDYYGGRPYLDHLVFYIYHGSPTDEILEDFFNGRLDLSSVPTWKRRHILSDLGHYKFLKRTSLSLFFYGLNNTTAPLDRPNVRKAINIAIDRDYYVTAIVEAAHEKATGILPPGMFGYNPGIENIPFDVHSAMGLISDAYDEYRDTPFELTVFSASASPEAQEDLAFMRESLGRIGIETNIEFVRDWVQFESLLVSRKADIFRYVWYPDFADPDALLYPLFHSSGDYNFSNYKSPVLDDLLERGRTEHDVAARLAVYREAERIILEDSPIVNICHYKLEDILQPYVRNLKLNPLSRAYVSLKEVWLEK
jgi:peptide/nickel transport system substrate-binding protein/oligopeptide transport system substrate-binding protein